MDVNKRFLNAWTEIWDFQLVGSSFPATDGTSRQSALRRAFRKQEDLDPVLVELERYEYDGDPAYHVLFDDREVGNVPADIAQAISEMSSAGYSVSGHDCEVYGGPEDDFPDKKYGARVYIKLRRKLTSSEQQDEISRLAQRASRLDHASSHRSTGSIYCSKCGKEIDAEALICPYCGCGTVNYVRDQAKAEARAQAQPPQPAPGQKIRTTALLLCIFLGGLGAHRFYVGKIGTGILWLLTLGFGGIGTIIDLICIICGTFTDEFGNKLFDPHVRVVQDSSSAGETSGSAPAPSSQPAAMTQEEYDEATRVPRTVRKIVLIVLAVAVLAYVVSLYYPELFYIFRR